MLWTLWGLGRDAVLALKHVFNPYSNIFVFFLDNLGLFRNNYLVNKYSKINFDNA